MVILHREIGFTLVESGTHVLKRCRGPCKFDISNLPEPARHVVPLVSQCVATGSFYLTWLQGLSSVCKPTQVTLPFVNKLRAAPSQAHCGTQAAARHWWVSDGIALMN